LAVGYTEDILITLSTYKQIILIGQLDSKNLAESIQLQTSYSFLLSFLNPFSEVSDCIPQDPTMLQAKNRWDEDGRRYSLKLESVWFDEALPKHAHSYFTDVLKYGVPPSSINVRGKIKSAFAY